MRAPRLAPAALLLPSLLLLGACGGGEEIAPGGLSADEVAELNEAAAMLDNDAVSANAVLPAASSAPGKQP